MSRARAIAFSAVGGAAAALLTANVAFAQDHGFGGDGFGRRHRGGEFMFFFPLLLLLGVAALLIVLWRGRHTVAPVGAPPAPPVSPTLNAQGILADRLARGEISPDDYRAAITVLRESPPAPPPAG
jgi:putative membrane protein